jgi:hypothetical protein
MVKVCAGFKPYIGMVIVNRGFNVSLPPWQSSGLLIAHASFESSYVMVSLHLPSKSTVMLGQLEGVSSQKVAKFPNGAKYKM